MYSVNNSVIIHFSLILLSLLTTVVFLLRIIIYNKLLNIIYIAHWLINSFHLKAKGNCCLCPFLPLLQNFQLCIYDTLIVKLSPTCIHFPNRKCQI